MIHPILQRAFLPINVPASWLYGAVVCARNRLYSNHYFKVHRLPTSVVSVGNLTVGGSGKSPLVAHIARYFRSKQKGVAVLSRGYLRRGSVPFAIVSAGEGLLVEVGEAGDEPYELAQSVEGLVTAVGADRFRTGLEVIRQLGPHLFVLDDGFQHRRLFRNLDLICVDSGEPIESLRLLPAGRLREPLSGLNRAGALIWTRWKEGRPSDLLASRVLGALDSEIPVFRASQAASGFSRLGGSAEKLNADAFDKEAVGLLAAIARPERFEDDVEACGVEVVWRCFKRDHHAWKPKEVHRLLEKARARGARAVITTGKDAVKLGNLAEVPLPLYRMDIQMEVIEREAFEKLLDSVTLP
jgi:tetraacyldisaccharide 4'-kinase